MLLRCHRTGKKDDDGLEKNEEVYGCYRDISEERRRDWKRREVYLGVKDT